MTKSDSQSETKSPITIHQDRLPNQSDEAPDRITTDGPDPDINPDVYGAIDELVVERLASSPWPSVIQQAVNSIVGDQKLTEYDLWKIMKATNGQVATGHFVPNRDEVDAIVYWTPHNKTQLVDNHSHRRAGLPVLGDLITSDDVKTVLIPIERRSDMDAYEP